MKMIAVFLEGKTLVYKSLNSTILVVPQEKSSFVPQEKFSFSPQASQHKL